MAQKNSGPGSVGGLLGEPLYTAEGVARNLGVRATTVQEWIRQGLLTAVPTGLGLIGVTLVLVATSRYGAGLSPDSVTYISTAQDLLHARGYVQFDGQPLLRFPPLYPTLLALAGTLQPDIASAARWLNAVAFGLIVGISSHWILTRTRAVSLGILGSVAVLLCIPLIETSVYAWSETLFTLCALGCLYHLDAWARRDEPWRLWIAAAMAGLAWSSRYVGVAVVLTGVAWILLQRQMTLRVMLARVISHIAVSALPMAVWLGRNYLVSGSLTGQERLPSQVTVLAGVREAAEDVSIWLVPAAVPTRVRLALLGVALIAVVVAVGCASRSARRATLFRDLWTLTPFGLYVVIYATLVVVSTAVTALDPVNGRYLSPMYVPLIIALVVLLGSLTSEHNSARRWNAVTLTAAAVACWLVYPTVTSAGLLERYITDGAGGFHTSRWMDSELARYVRSHEFADVVYANEPYALYFLTGKITQQSPRRYFYRSKVLTGDLETLNSQIGNLDHVNLIWFDGYWGDFLYTPEDLRERYSLGELERVQDGAVYSITPGP
jgi:hypothetical protein